MKTQRLSFWDWLTRPHPSITDIEQRRQTKLLAALMVVLAGTSLLACVISGIRALVNHTSAATTFAVIPVVVVLIGIYLINRSGHYRLSAYLFIIQTFCVVHFMPLLIHDLSWMFFASMLMILTAILLSWRGTVIVFVCSVIAQIFVAMVAPSVTGMSNAGIMIVFIVTAPILMTFIQHRTQLEQERQQELQRVNAQLQESEVSLEKRVIARTRDLQIAADVSKQITTLLDLEKLLGAIVDHTQEAFHLYHVSIFLYHPAGDTLVLETGAGHFGTDAKVIGKRYSVAVDNGLVPSAARTRQPVIANNVAQEVRFVANPNLSNTRSELALPIMIGQTLLGVLDCQAEELNRFSPEDVSIMTTLADQIAIAVNNAQLYSQQVQVAEQLREIDNLKSRFLASMSHELRTPLNAVLNFTRFVAEGVMGDVNDQQKDALNKSLGSAKHLLSLINDVLDITKIESGMLSLFVEGNIDLKSELDTVVATAETLLSEKPSVQLLTQFDADFPCIVGDKRRIRQIMLNLVSNACKFTDQGSITISAHVNGDTLLMAVQDTGPGIAPEDQSILFEPFRQTEVGLSQGGGTGLGLAIAKRLAEAHGGRLWLESTAGAGAKFFFSMPVQSELLKAKMVTLKRK